MNTHIIVQDALLCLQELDLHPYLPLHPAAISRHRNLPIQRCLRAVHRLSLAGMIRAEATGEVVLVRPLADLTPGAVLNAVWASFNVKPAVQMLLPGGDGRCARAVAAALELDIALG